MDVAESEEVARSRVAGLAFWSGDVDPMPLRGGITNRNFVVEDRGRRHVVRLGDDIPVHGILRSNELAASRAAHAAGLSPAVLHSEPGVLILEYINGKTFDPADVRDPNNLGRLADLVRRCHLDIPKHLRGPAAMFWVFHVMRDYGHTLRDAGSRHVPDLQSLSEKAAKLEAAVGPIDVVFGHNDLLAANIMDDGCRLWLLDWDYAGFNSPLFDLGGLASNSDMPVKMSEALLSIYFEGRVDDELRRRAAAMAAASLLRECMWSMISEIYSKVDFDYAAYTADYRQRFEAAFAAFEKMHGVGC